MIALAPFSSRKADLIEMKPPTKISDLVSCTDLPGIADPSSVKIFHISADAPNHYKDVLTNVISGAESKRHLTRNMAAITNRNRERQCRKLNVGTSEVELKLKDINDILD